MRKAGLLIRASQTLIPNSRLVVIRSDAYHIAAANAGECVTHTLAFLEEQRREEFRQRFGDSYGTDFREPPVRAISRRRKGPPTGLDGV